MSESHPPFDPAESARAIHDATRPAPPRRTAPSPPPAAPHGKPTPRPPSRGSQVNIEEGMQELYVGLGMLIMLRDPELGMLIVGEERLKAMQEQGAQGFVPLADSAPKAWSDLAEQNRPVHDGLTKILQGSAWAEVMNAHMPLFMLVWMRSRGKIKLTFLKRLRLFRRKNGQTPKSGSPPNGPPASQPSR